MRSVGNDIVSMYYSILDQRRAETPEDDCECTNPIGVRDLPLTYGANLHVSSNANTNHSSYCDVGATYQLPSNTNDPHFLTGSNHFTVSEYQVFLV